MIDERMKEVLKRTEKTLCRHLEDLNDEVEQDGGRIKDHKVLDGIKDSIKGIVCLKELLSDGAEGASGNGTAAKATSVSLK